MGALFQLVKIEKSMVIYRFEKKKTIITPIEKNFLPYTLPESLEGRSG